MANIIFIMHFFLTEGRGRGYISDYQTNKNALEGVMSISEQFRSRTAAAAVALAAAFGATGCFQTTMTRGEATAVGAGIGAIVGGTAVEGRWRGAAAAAGAVAGGVLGSQFGNDCVSDTRTVTQARTNGNVVGQSSGTSTTTTNCRQAGNVTPGSIQTPTMTPRGMR